MRFLEKECVYEEVVSKSRFIGFLFKCDNLEEFKIKLKEIQKKYPKATHYCYAYSFLNYQKSSDDGEPNGTAGIPILNSIINNQINNVGLVVIRYFGGIKLGAGGLTRTYRSVSDNTIKSAETYQIIEKKKYVLEYDYSYNNSIDYYIKNSLEITNLDIKYNEKIERIIASNNSLDYFINLTSDKIIIKEIGIYNEKVR